MFDSNRMIKYLIYDILIAVYKQYKQHFTEPDRKLPDVCTHLYVYIRRGIEYWVTKGYIIK